MYFVFYPLSKIILFHYLKKWHFNKPHVFYLKPYSILNRDIILLFKKILSVVVLLSVFCLYKNLEIILNSFGVLFKKLCLLCFRKRRRKSFSKKIGQAATSQPCWASPSPFLFFPFSLSHGTHSSGRASSASRWNHAHDAFITAGNFAS